LISDEKMKYKSLKDKDCLADPCSWVFISSSIIYLFRFLRELSVSVRSSSWYLFLISRIKQVQNLVAQLVFMFVISLR